MATAPTAEPAAFDAYRDSYEAAVQGSIGFSGLKHDVFVQAKLDLLAELFRARFGEAKPSLLDVGCGVGVMHDGLRPLVRALAGSDLSREAIARAAAERPDVEYRAQEPDRLPWPDAAVDATLAVCVLHHVSPAGRPALLAEMRRVTRPGGLVVVIEHNPLNPLTRLAVLRCPFDEDAILLGSREARRRLREAGCRDVASRHFLLTPWRGRAARVAEGAAASIPLGAQYAAFGAVP